MNQLEQVRAVADEELRQALLSNIIECFVHQNIGNFIQKETIQTYKDDQEILERQIERYRRRPTDIDIPSVFNSCGLAKATSVFEMIRFPLFPFEMLKLLRQALERALIELHEFGIAR